MRENSSRRWGEMRSDAELKIEKRFFQDVSMTCGQIIRKAAAEFGMTILCPEELDREPVGFPVIQYRETDWEFIRRLASRFGLPVYPEPTMGGGKLCAGLPETGTARPMSCLSYTARMDRKFYQAGGEQEACRADIWNLPMFWQTEAGRGRGGLEIRRSPECRFSEP